MASFDLLPKEIIENILLRLSTESLIRWSCVSKLWRSVILSDPDFAKSHYTLSSEQQTLRWRLLIVTGSRFESPDLEEFGDDSAVRNLTCPSKPQSNIRLVGSSNGLVCCCDENFTVFILWNPSTGFFKRLPGPYHGSVTELLLIEASFGFCYLSATDDYKIFLAARWEDRVRNETRQEYMFSLSTKQWSMRHARFVEDRYIGERGAPLNDALHWLDSDMYGDHSRGPAIVAFDLVTEEVREMPLPNLWLDFHDFGVSAEGCLYVTESQSRNQRLSVWLMREYGVPASWTKLFDISVGVCGEIGVHEKTIMVMEKRPSLVTVVWTWRDRYSLVKVDPRDERVIEYELPVGAYHWELIEYEETLIRIHQLKYEETLIWNHESRNIAHFVSF